MLHSQHAREGITSPVPRGGGTEARTGFAMAGAGLPVSCYTVRMSQNVSVSEAARILGVSRRTIDRRIASGKLSTVDVDGARYVVLEDTEVAHAPATRKPAHVSELERMRAEIDELRTDRDRWRDMSQDLSQRLSEVTGTLYRLSEQKALPAPTEEHTAAQEPLQRPWWRFW